MLKIFPAEGAENPQRFLRNGISILHSTKLICDESAESARSAGKKMALNFSPADLADSADSSQIFVVFECAFVNCKNRRDPWEINSGYKFPADFRR